MILAGDIGATKTNIACFERGKSQLVPATMRSYPSRQFASLNDVVREFLKDVPVSVDAAAFGIAGPVVDGHSKLTNLGWEVDCHELSHILKLDTVGLINDLQATAYGALEIAPDERLVVNEGVSQQHAPIAVIAAGTGLGEGGLLWDGKRYRAIPSEGGHTEFGPRNEVEIDLLRFLIGKFGRVSYERIISGPGFMNVYEFFRLRAGYDEPVWLQKMFSAGDPSAVVSHAGVEGRDQACVETVQLIASLYGAEAGNLALKILATGGVFVGGGIAPKILPAIKQYFMPAFVSKGRYRALMEQMPVHIIMNDKAALIGAAHYALVMND